MRHRSAEEELVVPSNYLNELQEIEIGVWGSGQ